MYSGHSTGELQISIRALNETTISIYVMSAAQLVSSLPLSNCYITASLLPAHAQASQRTHLRGSQKSLDRKLQNAGVSRTKTVVCTNSPSFNEELKIDMSSRSKTTRLYITAWNKLSDHKLDEIIGVMSFSLKSVLSQPINGTYSLTSKIASHRTQQPLDSHYINVSENHYKKPRKITPASSKQSLVPPTLTIEPPTYCNAPPRHYKVPPTHIKYQRKAPPSTPPPPVPNLKSSSASLVSLPSTISTNSSTAESDIKYYNTAKIRGNSQSTLTDRALYRKVKSTRSRSTRLKESFQIEELAVFDQPACSQSSNDSYDLSDYQLPTITRRNTLYSSLPRRKGSVSKKKSERRNSVSSQTASNNIYKNTPYCKYQYASSTPDSSQSSYYLDLTTESHSLTAERLKLEKIESIELETRMITIKRRINGYGFRVYSSSPVLISNIESNSAAQSAGLKSGDRIAAVNEQSVISKDNRYVATLISEHSKQIQLLIWRENVYSRPTDRPPESHPTRTEVREARKPSALSSLTNLLTPTKRRRSKSDLKSQNKKLKSDKNDKIVKTKQKENHSVEKCTVVPASELIPSLTLLNNLLNVENNFIEVARRSFRFHANDLHLTAVLKTERETETLFQNMQQLMELSHYFSCKLDIVLRRADQCGGKIIATPADIYSPRLLQIVSCYMQYIRGLTDSLNLHEEIMNQRKTHDASPGSLKQQDVLPLEDLLFLPLEHIESVIDLFKKFSNTLSNLQFICAELSKCEELLQLLRYEADSDHWTSHTTADSELLSSHAVSNHELVEENELENNIQQEDHENSVREYSQSDGDYTPPTRQTDQSGSETQSTSTDQFTSMDSSPVLPLSDSMTALVSDSPLLPLSTDTDTPPTLQRADYLKHEAKQATTKIVRHHEMEQESPEHIYTNIPVVQQSNSNSNNSNNNSTATRQSGVSANGDPHSLPFIDLSAIVEESESDITNTSLHVSPETSTSRHLSLSGTSKHLSSCHDENASECRSTPNRDSVHFQGGRSPVEYENLIIDHMSLLDNRKLSSVDTSAHDASSSMNAGESKCEFLAPAELRHLRTEESPFSDTHHNGEKETGEINPNVERRTRGVATGTGVNPGDVTPSSNKSDDVSSVSTAEITALSDSEAMNSHIQSTRRILSKQKSFSEDNINMTIEQQRFDLSDSSNLDSCDERMKSAENEITTPMAHRHKRCPNGQTNRDVPCSTNDLFSAHTPSPRRFLARMKRSRSTLGIPHNPGTPITPGLGEKLDQLEVNSVQKEGARQRKFSLARNVRSVLSLFKKRSEENPLCPPVETVESWAHSFQSLLGDKYGLALFRNFLCSEYSEENIEFWICCEEYRSLKSRQCPSRAQKIYSEFINVHAPREVNLDSKTRLETMKNINHADKSTFDLAQSLIQSLMEEDSYPRFLKSTFYSNILQQARSPTSQYSNTS